MFTINDKEMLTKIQKFELFRNHDVLRIDVHEVISGKSEHAFFAIPNLFREDRMGCKEYFGFGESEVEALEDCLNKIKDTPVQLIVPFNT